MIILIIFILFNLLQKTNKQIKENYTSNINDPDYIPNTIKNVADYIPKIFTEIGNIIQKFMYFVSEKLITKK